MKPIIVMGTSINNKFPSLLVKGQIISSDQTKYSFANGADHIKRRSYILSVVTT